MPSRFESIELRSSRDKNTSQDALPPPYNAPHYAPPPYDAPHPYPHSHGISRSSLLLGLYIVIPALTVASSVVLGFKGSVAAGDKGDARAGQWLDEEGVLMAEWPSSMFPNQNELALAVAALALVTAVLMGALLLFVVRSGSLKLSFSKRLAIIIQTGLTAAFALAGTIHTFVLNARSAAFDPSYAMSAAPERPGTFTYDQGTFSREYWACSARLLPNFDADLGGVMARTCILEMGSRWVTLFVFLLSSGLFSLVYLDSRGGRHLMRS